MKNSKNLCPSCDEQINLSKDVTDAEVISCASCGSKYEVKIDKGQINLVDAPQVEEDWGQ